MGAVIGALMPSLGLSRAGRVLMAAGFGLLAHLAVQHIWVFVVGLDRWHQELRFPVAGVVALLVAVAPELHFRRRRSRSSEVLRTTSLEGPLTIASTAIWCMVLLNAVAYYRFISVIMQQYVPGSAPDLAEPWANSQLINWAFSVSEQHKPWFGALGHGWEFVLTMCLGLGEFARYDGAGALIWVLRIAVVLGAGACLLQMAKSRFPVGGRMATEITRAGAVLLLGVVVVLVSGSQPVHLVRSEEAWRLLQSIHVTVGLSCLLGGLLAGSMLLYRRTEVVWVCSAVLVLVAFLTALAFTAQNTTHAVVQRSYGPPLMAKVADDTWVLAGAGSLLALAALTSCRHCLRTWRAFGSLLSLALGVGALVASTALTRDVTRVSEVNRHSSALRLPSCAPLVVEPRLLAPGMLETELSTLKRTPRRTLGLMLAPEASLSEYQRLLAYTMPQDVLLVAELGAVIHTHTMGTVVFPGEMCEAGVLKFVEDCPGEDLDPSAPLESALAAERGTRWFSSIWGCYRREVAAPGTSPLPDEDR